MYNTQQVPQLTTFHRAAMLAHELNSPNCINWHALEKYHTEHGGLMTLAILEGEMNGANDIYLLHLNLAKDALLGVY